MLGGLPVRDQQAAVRTTRDLLRAARGLDAAVREVLRETRVDDPDLTPEQRENVKAAREKLREYLRIIKRP